MLEINRGIDPVAGGGQIRLLSSKRNMEEGRV